MSNLSDPVAGPRTLILNEPVLARNDEQAAANRKRFHANGLLTLNLVSSPGSGKTEFLVRTLHDLRGKMRCGVIVGDLATDNDARRLHAATEDVIQVDTESICHLDAGMIATAAERLPLSPMDVLFIENVGNLVCPAAYDLGEDRRVVLLSTPEGEDKPLKYPVLFSGADVVVLTKMDIAEAVGFDRPAALANIARTAPNAVVLEVSARSGQGMEQWYDYLTQTRTKIATPA